MPTVLTHAVAAAALVPVARTRRLWPLAAVGAACAVAPDLDVVGLALGVDYGDPLGHRGLSHSLAAAVLLAAVVAACVPRWRRPAVGLYLFAATASHGLLDMLTDGGLGVALLGPFVGERLFFPVRPIEVSPIGVSGFLTSRGAEVLASEALWVWLPSALAFALLARGLRRPAGADAGR